jgi:putative transposase
MKILKTYKFRIYPNKLQREVFDQYFGISRFVFNSVLAYKIDSYKHNIKYSTYDAIKDFTEIKRLNGYEWLKEINSQVIQQSILDLDSAFQKFFKDKNIGFPKFKSKKHNKNSFRVPQYCKIDFKNKRIKIPKIDWIKFRDKRIFNSKIKSITISKNNCNQYFASILIEEDFEQNLPNNILESKVFSADMSCKDFLVSLEMKFENQKFYRKNERKLCIRQRKLSKKQKDSNNRKKEKLKVAKTYLNITNKRKGYQWNLVHILSNQFDVLIFEDLNIKGMQQFNKGISKTITLDFSFSEFLSNLEWKCFKENKHFVKIDRWLPSSKLCSNCGQIKEDLKLSDRNYICECGLNIDRDLNASTNIKREGISILKEKGINLIKNSTDVMSESYAYGNMIEITKSA